MGGAEAEIVASRSQGFAAAAAGEIGRKSPVARSGGSDAARTSRLERARRLLALALHGASPERSHGTLIAAFADVRGVEFTVGAPLPAGARPTG
jgi:hypothetical protein